MPGRKFLSGLCSVVHELIANDRRHPDCNAIGRTGILIFHSLVPWEDYVSLTISRYTECMACAHPVAVSMQFKLGRGLVPVYLSWVPMRKIHVNQVGICLNYVLQFCLLNCAQGGRLSIIYYKLWQLEISLAWSCKQSCIATADDHWHQI